MGKFDQAQNRQSSPQRTGAESLVELKRVERAEAVAYQPLPLGPETSNYFFDEALHDLFKTRIGGEQWTFTPDVGAFFSELFTEGAMLCEVRESQIFNYAREQYFAAHEEETTFPLQELQELLNSGYRWGLFVRDYQEDVTDSKNRIVFYSLSKRGADLLEQEHPYSSKKPTVIIEHDDLEIRLPSSHDASILNVDPLIPTGSILAHLANGKLVEEYELLEMFLNDCKDPQQATAVENAYYLNVKLLSDAGFIRKSGSDGEYFYSLAS